MGCNTSNTVPWARFEISLSTIATRKLITLVGKYVQSPQLLSIHIKRRNNAGHDDSVREEAYNQAS